MRKLNTTEVQQVNGATVCQIVGYLGLGALGLIGISLPIAGVVWILREDQKRQQEEQKNIENLAPQEAYQLGYDHGVSQMRYFASWHK